MTLMISQSILTIPECLEKLNAQHEGPRRLDFTASKDPQELSSAAWHGVKAMV